MKVKDYLKTASYYYPNWDQALAEELIKKFELNTKQRINKMSKGMLSMVTIIVAQAKPILRLWMNRWQALML